MAEPQQSYQNHVRIIPAFHYLVFGAFTLDLALSIKAFVAEPSFGRGSHVLTAIALLALAYYARVFAVTVQDRVIRLEMRQRLREALPAALQPRVNDFTRGQLVALRFASDDELADLAQTVLRDNIQNKRAIKQMIKMWNPDHLRV
jgi:Family of unknown function (DUF6526)